MIKKILILLFFVPIFAKAQLINDNIGRIIWDPPMNYLMDYVKPDTVKFSIPDTTRGELIIIDDDGYLRKIEAVKVTYYAILSVVQIGCPNNMFGCTVAHFEKKITKDSTEYFIEKELTHLVIDQDENKLKVVFDYTYRKIPKDSIYQIFTFTKKPKNEKSENKTNNKDAILHQD